MEKTKKIENAVCAVRSALVVYGDTHLVGCLDSWYQTCLSCRSLDINDFKRGLLVEVSKALFNLVADNRDLVLSGDAPKFSKLIKSVVYLLSDD